MEIIKWILSHSSEIQVQFSLFCKDLEIEMRSLRTRRRIRVVLGEQELEEVEYDIIDVLNWMWYELSQYGV